MNSHEPESPYSEKPYELTFEYRERYLYAYVTGNHDSYEISIAFWSEIAAECDKTGYKKLLVEEDIPEVVSMNDMYNIASEMARSGFSGVCIAFVDRYAEHKDLNEFGEVVATNRGLFGRIFDNFDEGEEWLLGQ